MIFTSAVLCHNPPLPGLPDHTLPLLNHDQTQNQWSTGVYSNSNVTQLLLLYDVITTLANILHLEITQSLSNRRTTKNLKLLARHNF